MKLIVICSFLLLIFGIISGNGESDGSHVEEACKRQCFVDWSESLRGLKCCQKDCKCDPVGSAPCSSPCKCKPGYTGSKCDSCDYNYKRVGSKCIKKKWVCKPNRGRCYSNSCGYHGYSYMWCYCADCVTAETVVAAIFSLGISTDYHWEYCSCSYQ